MNEIANKVIKTKNIKEAMREYADERLLNESQCDFTLDKIDTYVRNSATNTSELVLKNFIELYADPRKIINEHMEFHQVYTITAKKLLNPLLKLKYVVQLGDFSANPYIILSNTSIIPYSKYTKQEMLRLLYSELNKIKAFNGMLIKLFDASMKSKLKVFIKYLYEGKFAKKIKLPLFDGIEPNVTRDSKLIYWYKEKIQTNQVIEVEENDILIEFKKPIFGKNGLNAYGESINANSSNNDSDLAIVIDMQSVIIEENQNQKLYKSKRKGYVQLTNNILSVDNKIRVEKLSRNNAAVASEEKNNIEVQISQHDTNKDSIGEGVELISESIHVTGHVGAKSVLEATSLIIDGATHKDSTQLAKIAKINRHKGMLRCHKATISLLEGGEVHATSVDIETCLGGYIYAQDVKIGQVKNNLKVYASNSITIRLVSGEDNTFKINYRDIPILKSQITLIDNDIDKLKDQLENTKRNNLTNSQEIKHEIQIFKDKRLSIFNSYKKAVISIERPLIGHNSIIFTIDDEHELLFKTDAESYSAFHLKVSDDRVTLFPVNKTISLAD